MAQRNQSPKLEADSCGLAPVSKSQQGNLAEPARHSNAAAGPDKRKRTGITETDGCPPVRQRMPPQVVYGVSSPIDFWSGQTKQYKNHESKWSNEVNRENRFHETTSSWSSESRELDKTQTPVQKKCNEKLYQKEQNGRLQESLHVVSSSFPPQPMDYLDEPEEVRNILTEGINSMTLGDYVVKGPCSDNPPAVKSTTLCSFSQDQDLKRNEDGDTVLHLAIIHEIIPLAMNIINSITESRCLDVANRLRQTPLHLATVRRQRDVIQRLLNRGAKRVVHDRRGNTPLHIACRNGYLDCVQELTIPFPGVLHATHAASNDLWSQLESVNYEGQTCLHLAASHNHLEIVRHLVETSGVNVNQKELKRGRTILHRAVEFANSELMRYLLNLDSQFELIIDEETYDRYTALQMAQFSHQKVVQDLLLKSGAQDNGAPPA